MVGDFSGAFFDRLGIEALDRIGVKANLLAQTKSKYFGKINAPKFDTSFYLLGWTPGPLDALNMLSNLAATRNEGLTNGMYNNGGYTNPHLDELISEGTVPEDLQSEVRALLETREATVYGHVGSESLTEDERSKIKTLLNRWKLTA